MNPLRRLADGWEYEIVNEIGTRYSRAFAPPECFADAEGPVREGDRVVVLTSVGGVYDSCHGICAGARSAGISVWLDNGEGPYNFLYEDVRRERPDERPAEKKPEPPPRKYEDGQHIKTMQTAVRGTIERAEWGFGDYGEWVYYLWPHNQGGDSRWTVQESACVPCPPPLSDAQRKLNPGDKVTVRRQRWGALGKPIPPSIVHPPLLSAGTILRSWGEGTGVNYRVRCAVRFGMGEDVAEYLHNLDPVEGGGA